jgi:hypothetical protein
VTCLTTGRPGGLLALRLALIVLLGAGAAAGCGKKGPPLAPIIRTPARVENVTARRLGGTVYLQFQIPSANSDRSTPADIGRVEVYGFTGTPLDNADLLKRGTLVASVPVRKPLDADEEAEQAEQPEAPTSGGEVARQPGTPPRPTQGAAKPANARPAPSPENGFDQGNVVVVTEVLGAAQATALPPKLPKGQKPVVVPPSPFALADFVTRPSAGPTRLYVVVAVSRGGRKGAPSARISVPLFAPSSPPSSPVVAFDEKALTVTWVAPADVRRPIQPPPAEGALPSTERGIRSTASAYNIYEVPAPGSGAPPAAGAPPRVFSTPGPVVPSPLNEKPVPAPPFVDARLQFGQARCYVVRSVVAFAGAVPVESDASAPACVTPADTFAPLAPTGLAAVASQGSISLIWSANTEPDLAGYLVLRAPAGSAAFKPLTPSPIKETTFNDTGVTAGERYAYVIVAVDAAGNRSAPSSQAQESAR